MNVALRFFTTKEYMPIWAICLYRDASVNNTHFHAIKWSKESIESTEYEFSFPHETASEARYDSPCRQRVDLLLKEEVRKSGGLIKYVTNLHNSLRCREGRYIDKSSLS